MSSSVQTIQALGLSDGPKPPSMPGNHPLLQNLTSDQEELEALKVRIRQDVITVTTRDFDLIDSIVSLPRKRISLKLLAPDAKPRARREEITTAT